jgi:hypothetical protein
LRSPPSLPRWSGFSGDGKGYEEREKGQKYDDKKREQQDEGLVSGEWTKHVQPEPGVTQTQEDKSTYSGKAGCGYRYAPECFHNVQFPCVLACAQLYQQQAKMKFVFGSPALPFGFQKQISSSNRK